MNEDEKPPIPQPNYTQIPNVFLDEIMPRLSTLAEIKVVLTVMRQTFGFHKKSDLLAISQIERLTGLSHQAAVDGIKGALAKGILLRKKKGNSFLYAVNIKAPINTEKPVNNLDQSTGEVVNDLDQSGSQEFRPEVVNDLDQSSQRFRHTKETFKKKKESTSSKEEGESDKSDAAGNSSKSQNKKPPKRPTGLPRDHPVRLTIAQECGWDLESNLLTVAERSQVADALNRFVGAGGTPEDVSSAARHFREHHFAGKRGDPPTPSLLVKSFREMKNPNPAPNGVAPKNSVEDLSAKTAAFLARKNLENQNSQGSEK